MSNEVYEFEIHRNAEGSILAYATLKGEGSGYRIAGPKAWGGSKKLAEIDISQRDLVEFIRSYAPAALADITKQPPENYTANQIDDALSSAEISDEQRDKIFTALSSKVPA